MECTNNVNLVISYDQELFAEGLAAILAKPKDMQVLGVYENGLPLLEKLANLNPDVLVVELTHLRSKQFDYLKQIHDTFPDLKLLAVSELITHKLLDKLLHYVHGYMIRSCNAEKLVYAVHEISGSGKYICAKAADAIFGCDNCSDLEFDLTIREKEILAFWLTSKDNQELASHLNISHSTVRTHLKNIRQKLGAMTHVQLMTYACKENIIQGRFQPLCKNCMLFCHE